MDLSSLAPRPGGKCLAPYVPYVRATAYHFPDST